MLINVRGVNIRLNMNPCDTLPVPAEFHGKANFFKGNSFTTRDGSAIKACNSPSYGDLHDNAYEETPIPFVQLLTSMRYLSVVVHQ